MFNSILRMYLHYLEWRRQRVDERLLKHYDASFNPYGKRLPPKWQLNPKSFEQMMACKRNLAKRITDIKLTLDPRP